MAELMRAIGGHVPVAVRRTGELETRVYREVATQRMWEIAAYGDPSDAIKAFTLLRDSTEGRPKESMEITSGSNKPIEVRVLVVRE